MQFQVMVREPARGVREEGLLVLLHGYGADERDLMGFAPALSPGMRIMSLRAPYETPMGGFAWFGIEFDTEIRSNDLAQASTSLDSLVESLSELRAELTGTLAIAGFSQGAMMALGAIARRPDLADAVAIMSGKVVPSLLPPTAPEGLQQVRMLVQHGLHDPLLPIECGREVHALLEGWGVEHTYTEYPMGHSVSPEGLDELAAFLVSGIGNGEPGTGKRIGS